MRKPFTKQEDSYIIKQLPISSLKKIASELHRTSAYVSARAHELGLSELIKRNTERSRIKTGNVPPNKGKKMPKAVYRKVKATMFKKGMRPHNTAEKDGAITIRMDNKTGRKYKYIRISIAVWMPLHQYRWEKKHGPVPKSYALYFRDGNSLNCTLRNLKLISRAELVRLNRADYLALPPELRTAKRLVKKLNKTIYGKEQTKRFK